MTLFSNQDAVEYFKEIQNIQGALGTAETGEALVEVARNAHKAEQELAALLKKYNELEAEYNELKEMSSVLSLP